MKKTIIILATLFIPLSLAVAQEDKDVALKIGVPGSIMLESAVSEKISLGVEVAGSRFYPEGASYTLMNGGGIVNSSAVGARVVWQPKGVFKRGAYLAGWADYLIFDYEDYGTSALTNSTSATGSGTTFAAGIMIGFQGILYDDLIISTGAGYGFIKGTNVDTTTTTTTYDINGNIASTTSNPSSANVNGTDAFLFDLYIGYLF